MRNLLLAARLDVAESLRARWFVVYSLIFGGIVVLLLVFGLAESRVMGFTGLTRLLVTYIQLCVAVLPVFVLITTVRSVAGDREAGVFEYMLSLPVPLAAWYWGKMLGRFAAVFLPVFLAMALAAAWAAARGFAVPWGHFLFNTGLLVALAWAFLGIGMMISAFARSVDVAQGTAFMIWLGLLLFLDLALLGIMIREQLPPALVVGVALANPMQAFRGAAMVAFDPEMMLMGPAAYVILDAFGRVGFLAYGLLYPAVFGTLCAALGYWRFRRGDLP
jgi:ABC-2 type transport system permease protein